MIRTILAEDQKMLRGALSALLQLEENIEIVAEVSDGLEALEAAHRHNPDLCILDIEMPQLNGLEVAEKLKTEGYRCKLMIVTTFARPGYLQKARELQIDGYLLKDEPIDFLVEAIDKVMKGQKVVSPDLALAMFQQEACPLTDRELEVLRYARAGQTTEQIAKTLFLTQGTVRNYLSSAIQKLDVDSRHQAILKAEEKGWL
jgi:two-component system response regulator DesR